ncbi:MAG: ROK family protein [Micrococcales bacterium]
MAIRRNPDSKNLGQNRDDVRKHNLATLLRMIHEAGTISRSLLTTNSGLNRSTISGLVQELEDLGLVTEQESKSTSGVGRPSLQVTASNKVVAFAVNPDIDAVTVGMVGLGGEVIKRKRQPLSAPVKPEKAVQVAAQIISDFRAELEGDIRIVGVGLAIPGQVRVNDGTIRLAPHLGWVETPIVKMMSQATALPVFADNDASIGCNAEHTFGAGRGYDDMVYLFASTGGIGGGVIIDGHQLRGAAGYGGELGHVRITSSSDPDYSGLPGTLESEVRRDEVLDAVKLYAATDEELLLGLTHVQDSKAVKVIQRQIDSLAVGIANFVNIFNPQVVVLGGYLSGLLDFDSDRLFDGVRQHSLKSANDSVIIRSGALASNLLMIGGAEVAFNELINDPSGTVLQIAKMKQRRG